MTKKGGVAGVVAGLEAEQRALAAREAEAVRLHAECRRSRDRKAALVRARRLAQENACRAAVLARMEKESFCQTALDFAEALSGVLYVRRNLDDAGAGGGGGDPRDSFTVSTAPAHSHGELMVFWDGLKLCLRPAEHGEWGVEYPAPLIMMDEPTRRGRMGLLKSLGLAAPVMLPNRQDFRGPVEFQVGQRGDRCLKPFKKYVEREMERGREAPPAPAPRPAAEKIKLGPNLRGSDAKRVSRKEKSSDKS